MPDRASSHTLRLGTRGSLLARAQSGWVARQLEVKNPGLRVELVVVATSGDRITDKPLHAFGGKGLFTKELELALLAGEVDFAVHSFKDVPVTMPLVDASDLVVAAVPPREDPSDCWVGPLSLDELPAGAVIGTGSLRRRSQLLQTRPDIVVEPIRGNIDTRLRKQREGAYAAVVLATAGLKRAGLFEREKMRPMPTTAMLPAPGQGALALQCRRDDARTRAVLSMLHDSGTATCVEAERAVVLGLEGDCHSPIAALAEIEGEELSLEAAVGVRDGRPPVVRVNVNTRLNAWQAAVVSVLELLARQGAVERLR